MTMQEALYTGLQTTVTGMVIVFLVLFILMLVLKVFEKVFYKKENKSIVKEVEKTPVVNAVSEVQTDDEELIAVLTAAVAASLNTSTYNLKIKSYRRVNSNTPAWNKAGVQQTIENRFN